MKQDKFKEVESKLESLASPGIVPGLARLRLLLPRLGNPQKKFPAVHVVGTNGKGSTCATLDSILREAGYKTALYTSPHLVSFGERLEIAGQQVTAERWIAATRKIEAAINASPALQQDRPTYFELITAAAFVLIAEEEPDVAILEAGLGGRLDATNTIKNVLLTLVTPIGIDHTEYLGNTIEKIAAEKFAVMRKGAFAIYAGGDIGLEEQFKRTAKKKSALAFIRHELCAIMREKTSLGGTDFSLLFRDQDKKTLSLHTPLIGVFQPENAALAVAGATLLAESFPKIDDEIIRKGVANTRWQGRIEKIADDPALILDGAHNPHAMRKLVETLKLLYKPGSLNVVLCVMRDKDINEILSLLKPLQPTLFCTQVPDMQRSLEAEALAEAAKRHGLTVKGAFTDPIAAIAAARSEGKDTVCCGSLYMVGYVKGHFHVR